MGQGGAGGCRVLQGREALRPVLQDAWPWGLQAGVLQTVAGEYHAGCAPRSCPPVPVWLPCLPPAGGGAVETALSVYLESFATTLGSREQMAIAEFADALLVIPKTLAVNAAKVGGRTGCTAGCTPQHVVPLVGAAHFSSDSWQVAAVCGGGHVLACSAQCASAAFEQLAAGGLQRASDITVPSFTLHPPAGRH